jgi:hypothetical protein
MTIETIKTYTGSAYFDGTAKVRTCIMYRCKECGLIKSTQKEIKKHECTKPKE